MSRFIINCHHYSFVVVIDFFFVVASKLWILPLKTKKTNLLLQTINFLQKTVVAVLDQMVNPYWPHLPKRRDNYETNEEEDGIEGAWRTIPDDPLDYHFYYHILDGDTAGRPPKLLSSEGDKWEYNELFDRKSKSCLHLIAKSKNKVIINKLAKVKWKFWRILLEVSSLAWTLQRKKMTNLCPALKYNYYIVKISCNFAQCHCSTLALQDTLLHTM